MGTGAARVDKCLSRSGPRAILRGQEHSLGVPVSHWTFFLLPTCLCAALVAGAACGGSGGRNSSPSLQSINVTPANKTIAPGSFQPFTATGQFSDGSSKDITSTTTWSESHPGVATVSGSGVVTAVADGTTNVTATSSGVTGLAMLIVQSGTPDPLGSVTAQSETCAPGGVPGTACYSLAVLCPGVSDAHAEVKVSAPPTKASGTVVFICPGCPVCC